MTSCSKQHEAGPMNIAFEHATMRPWFDTNCASCHATGKSNYLAWHYNSADYEASFDDHEIHHIYEKVYVEKSMPKDKLLSDSEMKKFKDWFEAGFPAK
jgi:hypothetical protein